MVTNTLYKCRKSRENCGVMFKNTTKEYSIEDAVKTTFTACIKADGNGWFTIDGGSEWYAEGGLWFEGKNLVDYDGVFNLAAEIVELLENNGYNCNEL